MTRAILTCSEAPAEVLATVALIGAERRLGDQDSVHGNGICRSEERAEIVRVFHAIERQKELVFVGGSGLLFGEKVFDPEELALPNHRKHTLMRIRFCETGKLVARVGGDTDVGDAAEGDDALEPLVLTVTATDT